MTENRPPPSYELELKEIELISNQTNARLGLVGQFISTSVALAAGVAAFAATKEIIGPALLAISSVFWMFAILIIREDLQMVAHDHYYYWLRRRIRRHHPQAFEFPLSVKTSAIVPWYKGLTLLRYLFPAISALVPIAAFLREKWPLGMVATIEGLIALLLLALNAFLAVVVVWGIANLRKASTELSKTVNALPPSPLQSESEPAE